MTTYVAFLRAVNVPGHSMVKMHDLKQVFVQAGCADVESYANTGNIMFSLPDRSLAETQSSLQEQLDVMLNTQVYVLCRTLNHLNDMIKRDPFCGIIATERIKLYVAFLTRKLGEAPIFPLESQSEGLKAIASRGKEIFIVSQQKENGWFGFPNNFVEREFGITATTRNWSTLSRMVEKTATKTQ